MSHHILNYPILIEYKLVNNQLYEPNLAHENDDCLDLYSNGETYKLIKGEPIIIGLGVCLNLSNSISARVYARSSTVFNYNLLIPNGLGIIDSGYKDEIKLIAIPLKDRVLRPYSKIAQIEFLLNDDVQKFIVPNKRLKLIDMKNGEFTNYGNNRGGGIGSTGY